VLQVRGRQVWLQSIVQQYLAMHASLLGAPTCRRVTLLLMSATRTSMVGVVCSQQM
jgi:hypothetical protein